MTNNEAIKKMKDWMLYRGLAPSTQQNYVMHVELLSRYLPSPAKINEAIKASN